MTFFTAGSRRLIHAKYGDLVGVTLIIPARFLNQQQGSYCFWEFEEGIKERIADFSCVRVGVESP
jgi:hypothetical protein